LAVLSLAGVACANIVPTPTITPTSKLPVWEKDYPLAVGNRWIFQATRYDSVPITEIVTTAFVITETVVQVQNEPPYYAAKIQRQASAQVPIYVSPGMAEVALNPAVMDEYWLIASGKRIYRQEKLDLANLGNDATIELVFPLQAGDAWYETEAMLKLYPDKKNLSMLNRVSRVDKINTPVGSFSNCYFIEKVIGGSTFENWFCPGIGWVDLKSDHHGTPFGARWTLIRYQFN
jgi:hypothetical protein